MDLGEIAAGLEVTAEQRDRGVKAVDATGDDLAERLSAAADTLPCTPEAAATVVRAHTEGTSIGESARAAGVAPVTAAKALHRCGVAGANPLSPTAREVVRDWLAGDLARTEALALTGATTAEFSLAAYVETHDPVPELVAAVAGGATAPGVGDRDPLPGRGRGSIDRR